jgi:hypothetical protein
MYGTFMLKWLAFFWLNKDLKRDKLIKRLLLKRFSFNDGKAIYAWI